MAEIKIVTDWRKGDHILSLIMIYFQLIMSLIASIVGIIINVLLFNNQRYIFLLIVDILLVIVFYIIIKITIYDYENRKYISDYCIHIKTNKGKFINKLKDENIFVLQEHIRRKSVLSNFSDIYWFTYYGNSFYVMVTNSYYDTISISLSSLMRDDKKFLSKIFS